MPNIVKCFFDVKKSSYYMFSSVEAFHDGLGFHIVVMVVSTVANKFRPLFQAVLIHVNTLITTSQA